LVVRIEISQQAAHQILLLESSVDLSRIAGDPYLMTGTQTKYPSYHYHSPLFDVPRKKELTETRLWSLPCHGVHISTVEILPIGIHRGAP
jgi:hypothetical protein